MPSYDILDASIQSYSREDYVKNLTRFLDSKSYKLVKVIENNYIYRLIGSKVTSTSPVTVAISNTNESTNNSKRISVATEKNNNEP